MSTKPNTAPHQSHSETSKEAAQKLNARGLRERVLALFKSNPYGLTIDQISGVCRIVPGTASARVRDLEVRGMIFKTTDKRPTRKNRRASVYVHRDYKHLKQIKGADTKPDRAAISRRALEEIHTLVISGRNHAPNHVIFDRILKTASTALDSIK